LGEPSYTSPTGEKEDCAAILLSTGLPSKNVFSDIECGRSMKYICEVLYTGRILNYDRLLNVSTGCKQSNNTSSTTWLLLPEKCMLNVFFAQIGNRK